MPARMVERSLLPLLPLSLLSLAACSPSAGADAPPPSPCPVSATTANVPGASSALEEVESFGDNPAGLKMFVHAPAAEAPSAVVLVLHGCTQTAADYVANGWNELGEREHLVIVYGEQSTANNPMRCFRWWDAAQIGKNGEARSLASMVTAAHARFGTQRAFVTGLSAGGAMASAMLASYPELFEAGAIMAGLPYKCAASQADSLACMNGRTRSASQWGALVPKASVAPRVSIWQGDADTTIAPSMSAELVKQWTNVNGVPEAPDETTTEGRATHAAHHDASGAVRVESWLIAEMDHGVALDPKAGCGEAGAFALDVGVCSTEKAASFFLGKSIAPPASAPPSDSGGDGDGDRDGAASGAAPGDDGPCR